MIELRNVTKQYEIADAGQKRVVAALRGVDLEVASGEFLAIIGRSGCGKSTLLNVLGGIDTLSSGTMRVANRDVAQMNESQLTDYRRHTVGIVFQFFNLLPLLTVTENAALPALLAGASRAGSTQRAQELLEAVGLGHRLQQQSALLSGGEMQRVAIARALINDPPILLADEPTGNLDSTSAESVLLVLSKLARERGKTVVMVTHSREAAAIADSKREMRDGVWLKT